MSKTPARYVPPPPPEPEDCNAAHCGACLDVDEMQACEDCGDLFCLDHIFDVLDMDGERFLGVTEKHSVYLCGGCAAKRERKGASRAERDDDGSGFGFEDAA